MDLVLTNFIRALRNADVRVSTAETIDALRAARLVGYRDRALLKDSLALTLPKTLDEKVAFDACFEQFFFARDSAPIDSLAVDAHGDAGAQDNSSSQTAGDGASASASGARVARSDSVGSNAAEVASRIAHAALQSALGRLLQRGNRLEIGMAISAAGQRIGIERIELFTQKGIYSRRILEAMGWFELQREIATLDASNDADRRRLGHELLRRRDWLREEVRAYVEQQFLLHADIGGRRLREDLLRSVRLSTLERRHHRLVQDLVRRMARRLVANYSRRKKVFKRGQLQVPRTLRNNLKYDEGIFDLHWKSVRVQRPKIFAICDVSGSVADHARFMLTFLYSLEEVLPKVRAFAFSAALGEVTQLFETHELDDAISLALQRHGGGATDYGQAFVDFKQLCFDTLDKRTTIIVLGDARNNGGDTRLDTLKSLRDRCRKLIWLNPEPRSMWNTGDSEMRHVGAYCHDVEECSTLAHLQRFVMALIHQSRS